MLFIIGKNGWESIDVGVRAGSLPRLYVQTKDGYLEFTLLFSFWYVQELIESLLSINIKLIGRVRIKLMATIIIFIMKCYIQASKILPYYK